MTPVSILDLLSCDEVEIRKDGFLWLRNDYKAESQPLLLHSTELFLTDLYPSMKTENILREIGYQEETEPRTECQEITGFHLMKLDETHEKSANNITEFEKGTEANKDLSGDEKRTNDSENREGSKDKKKVAPEYMIYQTLTRCNNLSARMQSAVLDIQYFRHRKKKDQNRERLSREAVKVRALEHQQQRLLSQSSPNTGESSATNESEDHGVSTDNNDIDMEVVKEPQMIRFVRTINSIRALYPHLLPILNHPRRDDRDLVIRGTRYKSRKRAMSWLLGTKVFDTTTSKLCRNTHKDVTFILEGLIPVDVARKVVNDPFGAPKYWSEVWIQHLRERATPVVLNPLNILAGDLETKSVRSMALRCDEMLDLGYQENTLEDEQYQNAVNKLHQRLKNLLMNRFPRARVSIYGSCLSNLSLGKGADVDLSLWIPEAEELQQDFHAGKIDANKYERAMKKFVFQAYHKLSNLDREFHSMQAITRARVPVVKGTYSFANNPHSPDGSINFDICFLNDIAVANSGLLREYSLVDPRVRKLMMAVKLWAKEFNITSAKDNFISSYAWMNMVVFYLQCLGYVPNLQCPQLMEAVGITPDPDNNHWHFVNKLDTCTLSWDSVSKAGLFSHTSDLEEIPVSALLYGFFEFYSRRFPTGTFAISIKRGRITLPKLSFEKISLFYSIEDPFETFNSHCPHDLGTPAGETGAKDIMVFISEAEAHLREVLCGRTELRRLWPEPPISEPLPQRQNPQKPNFTRFANQKGGIEDKNIAAQGINAMKDLAMEKPQGRPMVPDKTNGGWVPNRNWPRKNNNKVDESNSKGADASPREQLSGTGTAGRGFRNGGRGFKRGGRGFRRGGRHGTNRTYRGKPAMNGRSSEETGKQTSNPKHSCDSKPSANNKSGGRPEHRQKVEPQT